MSCPAACASVSLCRADPRSALALMDEPFGALLTRDQLVLDP
jgi:hypothetical protein